MSGWKKRKRLGLRGMGVGVHAKEGEGVDEVFRSRGWCGYRD
jgi:hypothetical protein